MIPAEKKHRYSFLIGGPPFLCRLGMAAFLEDRFDRPAVFHASTSQELDAALRTKRFSTVILLGAWGSSIWELLSRLKKRAKRVPVLVLGEVAEDNQGLRLFRSGVSANLPLDVPLDELHGVLRRILTGGKHITEHQAELLFSELGIGSSRADEALSDREFSVFLKLGSRQRLSEIAKELHLSVKTISTYRARILEKLGLKDNDDIVRYAARHRLVPGKPR